MPKTYPAKTLTPAYAGIASQNQVAWFFTIGLFDGNPSSPNPPDWGNQHGSFQLAMMFDGSRVFAVTDGATIASPVPSNLLNNLMPPSSGQVIVATLIAQWDAAGLFANYYPVTA